MKERHLYTPYLCSISNRFTICMLARVKDNLRIERMPRVEFFALFIHDNEKFAKCAFHRLWQYGKLVCICNGVSMKEIDSTDIDKIILNLKKELRKKTQNFSMYSYRKVGTTHLSMMLPSDFEWMEKEQAALKFYSKYRPELILSNLNGDICFTFRLLEEREDTLERIKRKAKDALEKEDGRTVFYDDGEVEIEERNLLWFDYKSFSGNETIYNLMFFLLLEGELLLGTFQCIFEDYDEWKPIVLDLFKTIY